SSILKNLTVKSADKSDETLLLLLQGPNREELPEILLHVVEAYTEILTEDNKAVGEEAVNLLGKMQDSMLSEKTAAEERYLKLIKEVGVEPTGAENEVVNPHAR